MVYLLQTTLILIHHIIFNNIIYVVTRFTLYIHMCIYAKKLLNKLYRETYLHDLIFQFPKTDMPNAPFPRSTNRIYKFH